jgi:hypothetical protein
MLRIGAAAEGGPCGSYFNATNRAMIFIILTQKILLGNSSFIQNYKLNA